MSQQLQITGGAKVRSLEGVITGSTGVLGSLPINGSNGIPQLDVNGKILVSQLPNSVMEYLGTWNAATNTPTLVNGTGNAGDVYLCNVAGTVNFGAGPITFGVGDQVIYSGTIWQKAGGSTGTVTSVAVTESGDALSITGSPITTSGTINIGFAGTSGQYVNGAGGLTTFPTLLSSVGLSMPSAFNVSNSPLTSNGTIAVTGAGLASQYVRGDGTLANFPTSGGGGGSVSYYLNGSINQGTFGGNTYYEMNKVPVIGAGTNFTINANGYIAQFITDANDPSLLEIPGGNWNFEMYFSASSGGGTPSFYVELYKYNGSTFTLIASSSSAPEGITNGTANDLYTTALAVPTTSLTITDRLAVRVYVTHSGRTITLHTEDNNLCQVITTFSTGITALNGLTAQVQYFGTGTSGSDFNISSATASHTFNLPIASATNTGKLSSTDWTTFNNKQNVLTNPITGTGTTNYIPKFTGSTALGNSLIFDDGTNVGIGTATPTYKLSVAGTTAISGQLTLGSTITNGTYTYTLPGATGTLAIRSDLDAYVTLGTSQVITGAKVFDGSAAFSSTGGVLGIEGGASVYKGLALAKGYPPSIFVTGFSTLYSASGNNNAVFNDNSNTSKLQFQGTSSYTYTFPANTGTIALLSDIPVSGVTSVTATSPLSSSGGLTPNITIQVANTSQNGYLSSTDWNTFNGKQNALTNPITGTGVSGRIPYFNGTTTQTSTSNLTWDNTGNFISTSGVYVYNTSTNAYMLTSNGDNIGSVFNVSSTRWGLGYGSSTSSLATAVLSWNDSGNVSIGNTNNTYKLDVTGTGRFTDALTATQGNFFQTAASGFAINMKNRNANQQWSMVVDVNSVNDKYLGLYDATSGAYRMTFTNTGNIGIGTTTPPSYSGYTIIALNNATNGGVIDFQTNGTRVATINNSSSDFSIGSITSVPFVFYSSGLERMRITSAGNVGIGTSSPLSAFHQVGGGGAYTGEARFGGQTSDFGLLLSYSQSGVTSASIYASQGYSNSSQTFKLGVGSGNTNQLVLTGAGNVNMSSLGTGLVYSNGGTLTSTNPSDKRLKENIIEISWGLNDILKLKPVQYTWKEDKINQGLQFGFIAQEVKEIMPEAVKEFGEDIKYLGLEKDAIYAALVNAIKELETRLKTLENK
jgi:hypothetical protein